MAMLDDLITARDNLAAELATNSASPQPSYSVAGRSIPWNEYRRSLLEEIESLTHQIWVARGATEIQTIAHG